MVLLLLLQLHRNARSLDASLLAGCTELDVEFILFFSLTTTTHNNISNWSKTCGVMLFSGAFASFLRVNNKQSWRLFVCYVCLFGCFFVSRDCWLLGPG